MLKITKMLAVLLAVAAFAVSATPAMGAATWTGKGPTNNWSDMLNWKLADGTTWASGDPKLGGNWLLNDDLYDSTNSICDVHTVNDWSQGRADRLYLNSDTKLYIPAGKYLERERFITEAGAEIYVSGTFKPDSRASGFYMEVSDGEWSCARWTYSGGGTVHINGSSPTQVYMGDFMSYSANSTPTLQFTLDAGGVTPFSFGADFTGGPGTGFATVEVYGIAAYLAGVGNVGDTFDVIVASGGLDYPAYFTTGLVDGGAGELSVSATGLQLEILPEPATMALLALGGLGLLLRRRRR